jgi:multiple sugar transport system substrate-binding protein
MMSRKIAGIAPARTTVAAAGLLLAAGLAACGSGSGAPGGTARHPVTITFWTSSSDPAETSWLISHFNATHKTIKVQGQYITSSDQSTAKMVAALQSGSEPNVIIGQDPASLPLLAESGKVVDLSKPLAAETAGLYPGIRSALFYRGRQLGMALGGVGDYVLFYNKKDFAAAGISGPPATWAQLQADAAMLSEPARHKFGFYVPWGTAEWISYEWEGLLWADGGRLLNPAGTKTAFDSPAGLQALTTWVQLVQDQAAPATSFAQAGSYDGAPAFAGGTVAMIIEGQWAVPVFNTAHVDYGVAPVPAGASGQSATGIGLGVASVFDTGGSAAVNAATAFVKWLATPAVGAYLTSVTGGLPSAPAQLSQPLVRAEAARQPTYQVFARQLDSGHSRPTVPAYTQVSLDLATQIQAALRGTETPAAALAAAAAQGNQAIANGTGS